jgi:predicted aspartyl protease
VGRIVTPVYINGLGPFRMLLDTGASHSTLSPELASKLALKPTTEMSVVLNGITGSAQVPAILVDRIQAGDFVTGPMKAPVLFSSVMVGSEGILGVAGLSRERILVDFERDRIVISRSRAIAGLPHYVRIPARLVAGGLLCVRVSINGIDTSAIIDTGAERTLGNLTLHQVLKRRRLLSDDHTTSVFGATPEIAEGIMQRVPTLVFAEGTITNVYVTFGDFHIFNVWSMNEKPTLVLGMDVLGRLRGIVLDYQRRVVYVRS